MPLGRSHERRGQHFGALLEDARGEESSGSPLHWRGGRRHRLAWWLQLSVGLGLGGCRRRERLDPLKVDWLRFDPAVLRIERSRRFEITGISVFAAPAFGAAAESSGFAMRQMRQNGFKYLKLAALLNDAVKIPSVDTSRTSG